MKKSIYKKPKAVGPKGPKDDEDAYFADEMKDYLDYRGEGFKRRRRKRLRRTMK